MNRAIDADIAMRTFQHNQKYSSVFIDLQTLSIAEFLNFRIGDEKKAEGCLEMHASVDADQG